MSGDPARPLRAVVCGTRFGRVYMAAIARHCAGIELAGILARGSERSRACADHYGVPLYSTPEELPPSIDLACVVVGAGLNGGPGAELAQELMARGLHVVQEHPLTEQELAACLRAAHRQGVHYRLNTHYPEVGPVRTFIAAARALLEAQPARFVDALCSVVVLGPTLEVIARALGRARPWGFQSTGRAGPYVHLSGEIGGVPVALRVQNQIHPANRDSFAHLLHRVTIGAEGGSLLLANTGGPVLWCPRMHMAREVELAVSLEAPEDADLDLPMARALTGWPVPSTRDLVGSLWPAATGRVLDDVRRAILADGDHRSAGQYQMAMCRLTAEVAACLGRVELLHDGEPAVARADRIIREAVAAADRGDHR